METTVLNYLIIVEKEIQDDGKIAYVTYVPTLGISDFGDSIDKALKYTEEAIKLFVETLVDVGEPIPPPDTEEAFMTIKKIEFSYTRNKFLFAY